MRWRGEQVLAASLGFPRRVIKQWRIAEQCCQASRVQSLSIVSMTWGQNPQEKSDISMQSRSLVPSLLIKASSSSALERRDASGNPLGWIQVILVHSEWSLRRCCGSNKMRSGALLMSSRWWDAAFSRQCRLCNGRSHLLRPHLNCLGYDDWDRHRIETVG